MTVTVASDVVAPKILGPRGWMSLAGMMGFVALLHVVGWGTLLFLVAPRHYDLGEGVVFGAGLGLTAYTLGLRHAFDVDHIAAIDNTTRKLMAENRRPLSTGFWFSLGHSTIVFGLCAALGSGVRALASQLTADGSRLHEITGFVGTLVSGVFLLLIGLINLVSLRSIAQVLRRLRRDGIDESELERRLAVRGLMNRLLSTLTRAVRKPWQMYPVGLLFGLGFDTATEISLLVLATGGAAFNLPWWAILTLPVLFAAGMSLLDTVDGCLMNIAYSWTFANPVRRVFYNLAMTALSVAVALSIGLVELLGLVAGKLHITTGLLAWIAELDLSTVGYGIVALFGLTWLVAFAAWRLGRGERIRNARTVRE